MKNDEIIPLILTDRSMPCPNCRYNLRGVTRAVCPECGETLFLHPQAICTRDNIPGMATPVCISMYRFGMTGLALGELTLLLVGFSSLINIPNGSAWQALLFVALLILHPAAFGLGLYYRKRILMISTGRLQLMGAACWWWLILPLAVVSGFALWGIGAMMVDGF